MLTLAAARRPVLALHGFEGVVAPVCALLLLLHPTPLSWPAVLAASVPLAARWVTLGRPWRATPFDAALVLLVVGGIVGYGVTLDPAGAAIRLAGLASGIIVFAWVREHVVSPCAAYRAIVTTIALVTLGAILLVHVAQPFLLLDRVPPLAILARLLEPLGLYRFLVADEAALQRFRLYASGVGAVAAVGLAMTAGLALATERRRRLLWLVPSAAFFGALLYAADNRGSMLAAAIAIGCLVVWWRPRLFLLAVLLIFGVLDAIALGLGQRGLNLRTIVERLDFWQNGFALAAETPVTGVGLGVHSVQLAYRAAFQPAYPPFNHTHNIFVQGMLEQGILGLAGLILVSVAVLRIGVRSGCLPNSRARAAALAACGGIVALLTAGLTEIAGLTTVGGTLLCGLLGLLAAAHDDPVAGQVAPPDEITNAASSTSCWQRSAVRIGLAARLPTLTGAQVLALITLVVLVVVVLGGYARPMAALPLLNAGTVMLYQATLSEGVTPAERAATLGRAEVALQAAATIDPASIPARRNLALVVAASGDLPAARRLADEAHALAAPDDRRALFGVGRAYVAAEGWDEAIATWTQAGAGPQLFKLGRKLVERPDWQQGVPALVAAAQLGAPGRTASDAIVQAALTHGETVDRALGFLDSLLRGGDVEYQARLEMARTYRRAHRLDEARAALGDAERVGRDVQIELERGLILLWSERAADAEPLLAWAAPRLLDPSLPLPDGDDPRYWLAIVQARLGKHGEAVNTARAGLVDLPPEQSSLRVPYHLLLGENLLSLGRPGEALAVYQSGQRLAPGDPRLADGISRARNASRR